MGGLETLDNQTGGSQSSSAKSFSLVYGPVPSRRLGRSLGINNIPPKICSYSCVYCQVGRTINKSIERRPFYPVEQIVREVEQRVRQVRERGERIDYLSFVPDGEPTLDINLGKAIELLKPLGIRIAVITNASLLWRRDVREDLTEADWVSLKIDTVSETAWRTINQPHEELAMSAVLKGIREFADMFHGELATESMFLKGMNDSRAGVEQLAAFIAELKPAKAYLAIPTRPSAERGIFPASEESINMAYQIFTGKLPHIEYLIGYEGDAFASTGVIVEDLLSITAVHPMRRDAVEKLLKKAGVGWQAVEKLLAERKLIELKYGGHTFYLRRMEASRWE